MENEAVAQQFFILHSPFSFSAQRTIVQTAQEFFAS